MRILSSILLFIYTTVTPFYLAADLKRGKQILNQEHSVGLYKEDRPYKLSVFDKYARMDLSGFAFSKKQSGKYTISYWKRKGEQKLEIYQVESIVHVDAAVVTHLDADPGSKERHDKRYINLDFHYQTYIINDGIKPQLVYTIGKEGSLLNYRIGKHEVSPLYEDVIIGQELPDENEMLKLIAKR